MGDNSAYTHMEASVIAAYNAGLRGEQLAPFLEPYRGTDIDAGGSHGLETYDGLDINAVILSQFASAKYTDLLSREPAETDGEYPTPYDDWHEEYADAVDDVTRRFGW